MPEPRADEPDEQPVGVCVIVLDERGRLLLGERLSGYRPGWFGLPGGRVGLSEPLLEAGRRELREETGLEARGIEYVGCVRERQGSRTFVHLGLLATDAAGTPRAVEPDRCAAWEWFEPSAVPARLLPGHRAIVEIHLDRNTPSYRDLV